MTWTVEYLTETFGDGQPWNNDEAGISGLRSVKAKTADMERVYGSGAFKGPHHRAAPIIVMPFVTADNVTPAECLDLADAIVETFEPLPLGTEEDLTIALPGRTYTMTGAPLDCDVDLRRAPSGLIRAIISFKVYNAVITVEAL